MTIIQWIIFFLVMNVIHGLATWKYYRKAGIEPWKAFVPFLNMFEAMKVINRPKWWMIFLYIPIVNLLMIPVLWVQLLKVFGKEETKDILLAIFTLGLYVAYINYAEIGKLEYHPEHDKEDTLLGSLVFAIIAASIVHTYSIQPYTIPTASLEKSLLIGDYLFVSKMHYGARTPVTTISMPMVHDTIPLAGVRSYLKTPQLPYFRFPGFQKIKNNDIVVFNWPADTVKRFFHKDIAQYKPIDKKSHYVKRCVGIPGDKLEIKNGLLFINDKQVSYPDRTHIQHLYVVKTKPEQDFSRTTLSRIANNYDIKEIYPTRVLGNYIMNLTDEKYQLIKKMSNVDSLFLYTPVERKMFGGKKEWTINNFGPIYIPKKGDVLKLNKDNYLFYKKIIETYDEHDARHQLKNHRVRLQGEQVFVDGKPVEEYTVQQNYYFMMGDNRSQSEDSRFWGYVPEDHIVGKPVFIFMSLDANKSFPANIRWNRVFTTVSGEGKRVSYLIPFIVLLVVYNFGMSFWRKKKKNS